jgi:hypothetical protein
LTKQKVAPLWQIDPFSSKNPIFDPKHKIPKNQWDKLNRFCYRQIFIFEIALLMPNQFWANLPHVSNFFH